MAEKEGRNHPSDFDDVLESAVPTDDVELAREFFQTICDKIDSSDTEVGGQKHWAWHTSHILEKDNIFEIWDLTEESDCVRLNSLLNYFAQGYEYNEEVEREITKYEDEFGGNVLYQFCQFKCYKDSTHSLHLQKAFTNGIAAAERISTRPSLYEEIANVGLDLVRDTDLLALEIQGSEVDKNAVLSECAKYAEKAVSENPDRIWARKTYASVLELQGEFEAALEVLREGRDQQSMKPTTENYEKAISDTQRQKFRHEIDSLNTDLSQVESELEAVTEQYRSQILQFIGFFAAILAVALGSVQIATQLSFPQSGGLVLILIGGITISFGELEALFGDSVNGDRIRNWRTLLIGFILITTGLGVGILGDSSFTLQSTQLLSEHASILF